MKHKSLLELDLKILYFSLLFVYLLIAISTNNLVFTKEFYLDAFSNQLSDNRIEDMIQSAIKYEWIGYISLPIILILKLVIIAGIIYIGVIFSNYSIGYTSVLRIVMIAEFSMIFVALTRFIYLVVFNIKDLQRLKTFYPLSLVLLFNSKQVPRYLIYPLQICNLFEVGYWLILIFALKKVICQPFLKMVKLVISTYGIVMFFWILFIDFIQLQFNYI